MTKKTRKKFSQEIKDKAVDEYLAGEKTANEIAAEFEIDVQNIYRWKTLRDEHAKGVRIEELMT